MGPVPVALNLAEKLAALHIVIRRATFLAININNFIFIFVLVIVLVIFNADFFVILIRIALARLFTARVALAIVGAT